MQLLSSDPSSISSVSLGTGSDTPSWGSCQGCGALWSHGCREMFPAVGIWGMLRIPFPCLSFPSLTWPQAGARWNHRARLFCLP